MKGLNKKGESGPTSLGTVLTIVLGLAVVVLLIFGFSTNWKFFSSSVSGRIGTSNADAIVSGCQLACDTAAKGDYCSNPRTLKFGDERNITLSNGTKLERQKEITGTCKELSGHGLGNIKIDECSKVSC